MSKKLALISLLAAFILGLAACGNQSSQGVPTPVINADTLVYAVPDTNKIPHDPYGDMVRYGRDLVFNTAKYIGPDGSVGKYLGNKMNCSNCHLDGGTRPYGLNYFTTHARYPQYRGREDRILSLGERINKCIERPHNGTPMPLDAKEIIAIECYISWVGTNTVVGQHINGDESLEINYPDRPADITRGAEVYSQHCQSCHGVNGEGQWTPDGSTYLYPPLWGLKSYQKGSSPHRIIKAARFIKANMPDKIAHWTKPTLTDDQCVDVAGFINDDRIHPRPEKKDSKANPDYPNIKFKAIDYGIGPFVDTFSEMQHKFGPYKPIIEYHKAHHLPILF